VEQLHETEGAYLGSYHDVKVEPYPQKRKDRRLYRDYPENPLDPGRRLGPEHGGVIIISEDYYADAEDAVDLGIERKTQERRQYQPKFDSSAPKR
jgi:hypothetical protein